jgi:hypothetical protein
MIQILNDNQKVNKIINLDERKKNLSMFFFFSQRKWIYFYIIIYFKIIMVKLYKETF